MPYHSSEKLALAALAEIRETLPRELPLAQTLEKHFAGQRDYASYPRLHAALVLMIEKTPQKALIRIAENGGRLLTHTAAVGHVIDAINHGPDSWRNDKDYIYGLGFIHAKGRYFLVREGFEKGGAFDQAQRLVKPAYQPIIEEAIYAAFTKRNKTITELGAKILSYIPVQLLDRGPERDFKMNALSLRNPGDENSALKYSPREHMGNIVKSANAIKLIAALCKINLPSGLLDGDRAAAPEQSALARKQPNPSNDFARPAPPAPRFADEKLVLRRQLVELVNAKAVTKDEALVYFWLHTSQDQMRSSQDAASHFKDLKKTAGQISEMNEKVAGRLHQPSDRDLHKRRTVRP